MLINWNQSDADPNWLRLHKAFLAVVESRLKRAICIQEIIQIHDVVSNAKQPVGRCFTR